MAYPPAVRTFFNFAFGILILLAFAALCFFFINLSGGAEFERRDKPAEEDSAKK